MAGNKTSGDLGEQDVVDKVKCPNCGHGLMLLPKSYPLCDIQCTGCIFRAQIKTNHCKPKNEIIGAGWNIIDKTLKSGYLVPPLITNFVWQDSDKYRQKITFYPFIPKRNLKRRRLSSGARRANYAMFNYIDIDKLPSFVLYQK